MPPIVKTKVKDTKPEQSKGTSSAGEQQQALSNLFADVNVTMKSGHLVRDAEEIAEGRFIKLRLASNKQFYDKDKTLQTKTDYFNILVSSNLTETFETAQSFKKGDWVYIKGEDSTRSFDTPEGYKKTASTIFAYKVSLKKSKSAINAPDQAQDQNAPVPGA